MKIYFLNLASDFLSMHTVNFIDEALNEDVLTLTLLGLGLIKINDVSANFNNPRPSLILNN